MTTTQLDSDAKKTLTSALDDIDVAMTAAEASKDTIKNIVDKVCEETGLDKKVVRKLARAYHKGDMAAETALHTAVEELYVAVTEVKN
jgi:hypothetical protein